MSKKVRRVKRSDSSSNSIPNRRQIGGVGLTPARRPRGRGRSRQVPVEELQEEYAYVIKDLRRIFILAVVMFALLFLANIFLPAFF